MIDRNQKKDMARKRRQRRVRAKVKGTASRPRLSVFRSAKHISAQLIDDEAGKTLAAASDAKLGKKAEAEEGMKAKVAAAYAVGKAIAEAGKKA
ncbi:MAG TPA: 50S ribosomal protein L18, partial [Patescibacteria group bacterium]|nr:50S ribosomal protein L18 [Patescibacteria group bacterium]